MNTAIKYLTLLLVLQLGLVLFNNIDSLQQANPTLGTPLIDVSWSYVDHIQISDQDKTLLLVKQNDHWELPDYYDLRVDSNKISPFLAKLEDIDQEWPVGKTAQTRDRFEVSDDNFQRKIALRQGDQVLSTLLTGTSPGYRKVHARLENEDEIYAVKLSNFEANVDATHWFDRAIAQLSLNDINEIQMTFTDPTANYTLNKASNNQWSLAELSAAEAAKQEAISHLISHISQFTVEAALGTEALDTYQQNTPVLTIQFFKQANAAESQHQWVLSEPTEGAHFVLKSSEHPVYFKINRAEAEKLTTQSRSLLVEPISQELTTDAMSNHSTDSQTTIDASSEPTTGQRPQ